MLKTGWVNMTGFILWIRIVKMSFIAALASQGARLGAERGSSGFTAGT